MNVVPGIGFSPDKMLQARIFSYPDAHRYRLGVNYQQIPVNQPKCPYHTYNKDGLMRVDGNQGSCPNYEPNSFAGPIENPAFREPPLAIDAEQAGRFADWHEGFDVDDFKQPGDLYRLMSDDGKQQLIDAIVGSMKSVPRRIQEKQCGLFARCDADYGGRIAEALGIRAAQTANR